MSDGTSTVAETTARLFSALSLDGKQSNEIRQVSSGVLEFLLPELVNTLVSTTLEAKLLSERITLGLEPEDTSEPTPTKGEEDNDQTSIQNTATSGWIDLPDDKELMEQVYVKLEMVGFRVGRRLAERFAPLNRRLTDTLDVVKFVCKDVWVMLFNRQIDNLKTNHRGVYVLQDNKFKWFLRMSGNSGGAAAAKRAQPYIWLPCGIIRGILDSFGVSTVVIAETLGLPQCTFQIKVVSDD
ncbi:hypothetical protein IW140_001058 [Coemansia sp. RSA 1813]|nr:hypothetical protein EV178_005713 [Coemansia sp. RSA 1646]KAJ1773094.1 hypothetical protein LPJ74_000833 [Coemansia sp. RSA 1843]KAJ2086045.1 hypothetical protein IW138_005941 [Coemansia sp. RSA 986]KAJ2211167.1 hypothetical protein EV179_005707 [Coemansia sp. RSA 487]KAJ2572018.1 hypothetical protein IW140_001058 [Coemansia sp. RSA 1813]